MKIEILGSGCKKCKKTEDILRKIVSEQGVDAKIVKVEDINEIIDRGVMMTPAVIIDGIIKISGHVPTEDEVLGLLEKH